MVRIEPDRLFMNVYPFMKNTQKGYWIFGGGKSLALILKAIQENALELPERIVDREESEINGIQVVPESEEIFKHWQEGQYIFVASISYYHEIKKRLLAIDSRLENYLVPMLPEAWREQKKSPFIYLNTIPKSGNKYIANNLLMSPYCSESRDISAGPWGNSNLHEFQIKRAIIEGGVLIGHASPSSYNVGVLKDNGIHKMVLHTRDPRAATLSFTHWINKKLKAGNLEAWAHPPVDGYAELPFEKQLDVVLSYWLDSLVEYIEGWIKIDEQDNDFDVLFTNFTKMKNEPQAFFDEIMAFYGLDHKVEVQAPKEEWHFRAGQENEWMNSFTSEQRKFSAARIPSYLKEQFDWPLE
ncbi:Sulfotransferase domain protein [Marinomonas aquimarina]|uniref:Sulfotransferase domain protein n=1 Tax=Marinomonas aquimarina TaxID=295068 RepID=A0A1A8T276_9GAMM|nr:sulfotransferase domain-containing protein [Marinomonas aquimarina]SBS25387.1 Sulfotransferase domain protein [Marinomonas aquimarina]